MTKRIIALCLALAAVTALLAGCELRLGPEKAFEIPAIPEISPEDMALLSKLMEDDEDAWKQYLEGVLPEGIDLAPEINLPAQPAMMPAGEAADRAEVLRLMRKVQDTFKSRTFYLKGRGNNFMDGTGGSYAPMTIAVDQDKMMLETEFDWNTMMKMSFQEQGKVDVGQSKLQASIAQATLGSKMRLLFLDNNALMVFPEKKISANFSALAGEDEDAGDLSREMVSMFDQFGSTEFPEDKVKATKVTQDKKEYLCATVTVDALDEDGQRMGTTTYKYYFLKGDLKRLEVALVSLEDENVNMVIEVDTFSSKVDSSLFSTRGYAELKMGDMAKIMGVMNF